jgi:hypothetical protein
MQPDGFQRQHAGKVSNRQSMESPTAQPATEERILLRTAHKLDQIHLVHSADADSQSSFIDVGDCHLGFL